MFQCHQPPIVVQQIAERHEKIHRDNVVFVALLSLAFFFGCLLTSLAILALVVLSK